MSKCVNVFTYSFIISILTCSNKKFPVFGFGAQVPPAWQVLKKS